MLYSKLVSLFCNLSDLINVLSLLLCFITLQNSQFSLFRMTLGGKLDAPIFKIHKHVVHQVQYTLVFSYIFLLCLLNYHNLYRWIYRLMLRRTARRVSPIRRCTLTSLAVSVCIYNECLYLVVLYRILQFVVAY